ncbi:MAG TPA: heme-copper oxidase subunit III [Solirubrobacteraceae bacterium]|nr:heme-copper oxidase subunit III [Solirubrobacteraceae bacterium]
MTRVPQVTRSAAAWSASATGRVARERAAQPNGWWGMALFLCAEATLFGTLIATYFYLNFDAHRWPPAGIKPPSVALPLIATGVLVTTSVPMWLAARSARAGMRRPVIWLMVAATIVQCAYLAAQVLLFRHDLNDFTPQGSAYGSIYFTLLAFHHAHVLLGILLNLSVLVFVWISGLTNYWLIGVRGMALYWHVVNAIAVLVVLTQLSPSL